MRTVILQQARRGQVISWEASQRGQGSRNAMAICQGICEGERFTVYEADSACYILPRIRPDNADQTRDKISWLSGFPGVSTLAADLTKSGHSVTSSFFEKDNSSRTSPAALRFAVACHLADRVPTARNVVLARLKRDERVPRTTDIRDSYRDYIEGPWQSTK